MKGKTFVQCMRPFVLKPVYQSDILINDSIFFSNLRLSNEKPTKTIK